MKTDSHIMKVLTNTEWCDHHVEREATYVKLLEHQCQLVTLGGDHHVAGARAFRRIGAHLEVQRFGEPILATILDA